VTRRRGRATFPPSEKKEGRRLKPRALSLSILPHLRLGVVLGRILVEVHGVRVHVLEVHGIHVRGVRVHVHVHGIRVHGIRVHVTVRGTT
jgi:hypothetical protein